MTQVFFTRVWGFEPETWPAMGFNDQGGVSKLAREYKTGDWLAFVGTTGEPTSTEHRGRLLGICQITTEPVEILPILEALKTDINPNSYNDNNEFRWPTGFVFTKAFRFIGFPVFKDVLPDRKAKGFGEVSFALKLEREEAEKILSLPMSEATLPDIPEIKSLQLSEDDRQNVKNGVFTGPLPSLDAMGYSKHDGTHYVYAFELPGAGYKVGFTNSLERRLKEFNSSPVAALLNKSMAITMNQECSSSMDAFMFEQALHKELDKTGKRAATNAECYYLKEKDLRGIWSDVYYQFIVNGAEQRNLVESFILEGH